MSYRKAPRVVQKPSTEVVIAGCFAWLAAAIILLWFEAWMLMLVIGALHHEVDERIPALGFIACIWISVALNLVATIFKSTSKSEG